MKFRKCFVLLSALMAILLIVPLGAGCMRTTVAAQGWSGIAGSNGQLFYLTTVAGSGGGGFLGCGSPASNSQLIALSTGDGGVLNTFAIPESTVFYGTPVISGDFAYITGYNGRLYRVNTVSGGTAQSTQLNSDKPQAIIGGAVVANGLVFAASADGRLYALDATTLAKQWQFSTGDQIWSTPAVSDGTVYIGSFDKNVYAVDAASGAKKWSYATQGVVVATPVVSGGVVYVASLDRHVYALDAASGNLLWQFPAADDSVSRNWFWATPVLVGGKLYAPNTNGVIYVINASDGSLVADLDTHGSIKSSPVIVGSKVVVVTEEGEIYTIDTVTLQFEGQPCRLRDVPASGTSNSKVKVRASLSVFNGLVYIQTTDPDRVFEFNPVTGNAGEIGTKQSVVTSPPPTNTNTVTVTATVTVTTAG